MVNKPFFFKRHTVHPAACGPGQASRPIPSYGSWCTPEESPTRDPTKPKSLLDQIKAKIEEAKVRQKQAKSGSLEKTKAKIDLAVLQRQQAELNTQKHRLVSAKLLPPFIISDNIQEAPIELDEIQEVLTKSPKSIIPMKDEAVIPDLDTPQSPVPTSPSRSKKCTGSYRLPTLCDPFISIDPQGRGYISWLFLVTFCYSYNAWCIALRSTFPYQTKENTYLWMMGDYFCDLVYLLDVALVKPRLMYLHEGFWVNDPTQTRKNYRKKSQYKFDVISLLPLDILYVVFGTKMVILRLPRMLKLQTFWEFHQSMDRVLSSPYVVRVGKMLFYILYLIHLNACAYYAMSVYEGLGSNSWVYDNVGNAYIRCFYFATKTATSIGKNPKPENGLEYLFMTAAWLMGVFVFALLIGQIRDIIATATRARAEYRKNIDGSTRYLRKLNMPAILQQRVTAWYNYTWNQQRCFDESKILDSLPYNMKRDVALEVHMNTLSKVQLFTDCSSSLLRDLVLQLRPVSYLPGDVVVRRGDVGHHMFIVKSGECVVMSPDEKEVLATLTESAVFGEISLLGIDGLRRRTATVRSRGYSSLFALSRSALETALQQDPAAAGVLRRRADRLMRENAARLARQRLRQARKSASMESGSVVRRRRVGSVSSAESCLTGEHARQRTASATGQGKRKLSMLSENLVNLKQSGSHYPVAPIPRCSLPTIFQLDIRLHKYYPSVNV